MIANYKDVPTGLEASGIYPLRAKMVMTFLLLLIDLPLGSEQGSQLLSVIDPDL